jgi:DNA-binding MarR family transcriptional regulator
MTPTDATALPSREAQRSQGRDLESTRRDQVEHARALRRLATRLGTLADSYEDEIRCAELPTGTPAASPRQYPLNDNLLVDLAQALYSSRRKRNKFFDSGLFAEPAWDILLDLFSHYVQQSTLRTTSVCRAANVPLSTALRWLTILENRGLIQRYGTDRDKRTMLVQLTDEGAHAVRECLTAFWNRLQLMLD